MGPSLWSLGKHRTSLTAVHDRHGPESKKPITGNFTHRIPSGQALPDSNSKPMPQGPVVSHTLPPPSHRSSVKPGLVSSSIPHRPLSMPIAPALLGDPAFSKDPRSNPHFVTKARSFSAHHSSSNKGSDSTTTSRPRTNTSQLSPTEYSDSPTSIATPPTTPGSVPSLSPSTSTTSHSSSLSLSPSTPPSSSPPSYESILPKSDTQHVTHPTFLPNPHDPVKTASQPPRIATNPREPKIFAATNRRLLRTNELDRIDELDETDPLGVPWHHGGPYEAIYNLGGQVSLQQQPEKVSFISDLSVNDKKNHRSTKVSRRVRNGAVGVSLNLVPGQILPRMPVYDTTTLTPPHPLCQPQPQPQFSVNEDDYSQQSYLPYLQPLELESTNIDRHSMIHQQGANDRYEHPGVGTAKVHHRSSIIVPQSAKNSVSFDANPVPNHGQTTNRRSSWQGSSPNIDQLADSQYRPDQNLQTAASLSSGRHSPLPDHRDVLQRAPSSSVSARSQRSASTTGSKSSVLQPRHLPKNLVMPTPLQQDAGVQRQISHRVQPPSSSTLPDSRAGLNRASSQTRAQDIPMLPSSRKLRKRTGSSEHSLPPPTQFTATATYASSENAGTSNLPSHMNTHKTRAHKRLSKRRNDL